MRLLKFSLIIAALSLTFISCGDDNDDYLNDPPPEQPLISGAYIDSADYILETVHKSYYNPYFIEDSSDYKNHAYGLKLSLKLNDPVYLNIIDLIIIHASDGINTLYYEFDKYTLHEMFSETLGGYILTIDSLYYKEDLHGELGFYPEKKYTWTIWLHDKDMHTSVFPYKIQTFTDNYRYKQNVSSEWRDATSLIISFLDSESVSSRKARIILFDAQKKYVQDYAERNINYEYPYITINNVSEKAVYYRVEISEVSGITKRSYIGKFETMPER